MSLDKLLRHEQDLRRFLLGRLGCPSLVDDIYQSLAEKVLKRKVDDALNPRAYLFQSAANAVSDYYRAQQNRDKYQCAQQQDESLYIDSRSPQSVAEASQAIELIENSLSRLPRLTQRIFYMYRLEGLSQQKIATQLGVSRSTVERHLSKAIARWQADVSEHLSKSI